MSEQDTNAGVVIGLILSAFLGFIFYMFVLGIQGENHLDDRAKNLIVEHGAGTFTAIKDNTTEFKFNTQCKDGCHWCKEK